MRHAALVQDALWLVPLALQAVWAYRVWQLHLIRRYPVLFTYLSLATLLGAVGYWLYDSAAHVSGIQARGSAYSWFWLVSRPLMWILFFSLILEIYSLMLESYAGIRRLGRLVLFGGLGSIATIVAMLIYLDTDQGHDPFQLRAVWVIQEQSVYLSIAAFVFVLFLFRKFFGLAVPGNVHLVFVTFGFYFAGTAGLLVLRNYLGPEFTPKLDVGGVALYGICLGAGSLLFSRAGETENVGARVAAGDGREAAALAARQLASFNDQLVRVLGQ
jgi:hypothetical protein